MVIVLLVFDGTNRVLYATMVHDIDITTTGWPNVFIPEGLLFSASLPELDSHPETPL